MRYQGIIARWNDDRGFGFVQPKMGAQPVFVHVRGFSNRQRCPRPGEGVSYELGSDAQGRCCAINVRYADEKQSGNEIRINIVPIILSLIFVSLLVVFVWIGRAPIVVGLAYLLFGLITFGAYAQDKEAAEKRRWRIPENKLHLFGLLGGWPGAVLAQQFLRHKSNKKSFQLVFWLTVVLNWGAFAWLLSTDGNSIRLLLDELI